MIRVTTAEPLSPLTSMLLRVAFSDGSEGVADMSKDLPGVLEDLRNPDVFAKAHADGYGVAWSDDLDVPPSYVYALAHGFDPPKDIEDAQTHETQVALRQLRELAGKSQVEVAAAMGVAQTEVSRLEHRKDAKLSTIVRYVVEGLGGEVELVAVVGGQRRLISL